MSMCVLGGIGGRESQTETDNAQKESEKILSLEEEVLSCVCVCVCVGVCFPKEAFYRSQDVHLRNRVVLIMEPFELSICRTSGSWFLG